MKFDTNAARSAGYSDDEIADYLAKENNFDVRAAIQSGYSASEVVDFLAGSAPSGGRQELSADVAPSEGRSAEFAATDPRRIDRQEPGLIERAKNAVIDALPMPLKLAAKVAPAIARASERLDAPAPKAEGPKPAPYKDRREALDDAVNLIEEGYDQGKVAESFANAGIKFDEIVAHGQKRGSEYFKQQIAPPPTEAGLRALERAPTGEIKNLRSDENLPGVDVALAGAKGVVGGFKMLMNAGGAGKKATSYADQALAAADQYLGNLRSAAAEGDDEKISQIMDRAKDGAWTEQVAAAAKAFSVAPASMVAQGLGTSVPVILTSLLPGVRESTIARLTAGVTLGAAQGAGSTKESIYNAVREDMIRAGVPKIEAEERAVAAQSYLGKNKDQIAIGMALGALASSTGVEKVIPISKVSKVLANSGASRILASAEQNVAGRFAIGGLAEAAPEFLQGSAEQVAQNVALQREGREVPTFQGAVGQGTLEGLAGLGAGGVTSAAFGRPLTAREQAERALSDALNTGEFSKSGIDANVAAASRLGVGNYNPTLIDPRQTMRQATDVGPAAPAGLINGTINFTPVDSASAQAGLAPIVVPIPTASETPDVSTTGGAGSPAQLGSLAGGNQPGGGLGLAGLSDAPAEGLSNLPAGVNAADTGPTVADRGAAGQQPARLIRPFARATDADLLARTEASIASQENNNAVVQPAEQWFGRKGDGYNTQADASQALLGRQRMFPDLGWKVESMANGKFRLAGYPATQENVSGTQTAQAIEGKTQRQETAAIGAVAAAGTASPTNVQGPFPAGLKLAPPAPLSAIKSVRAALQSEDGLDVAPVSVNQMNDGQKLASTVARLLGKTLTVITRVSGPEMSMPNGLINRAGGKHIMIADDTVDAPLFVTMHEAYHGLSDDKRAKLNASLLQLFREDQKGEFQKQFSYTEAEFDEEAPAFMVQAISKRADFWEQLREKMGNKEFADVAKVILSKLNQILTGANKEYGQDFADKYISDIAKARDLLTTAYAEAMQEQGLMPDTNVTGDVMMARRMEVEPTYRRIEKFNGLSLRKASADIRVSAASAFADGPFTIAPGVREVPIADIEVRDTDALRSPKELVRVQDLAAAIKKNNAIEPLFVARRADGSMYVAEGAHRVRALKQLGFTSVPARIMVDSSYTPKDAAAGGVAMSRRAKTEKVGEFDVAMAKDGSLTVYGDSDAIRAQIPDNVQGRVTKEGITFTNAAAPRVRAALEGRQVAYSRGGQVTEKLPMRDGKYLGAPEKFGTPGKVPTLRKLLRQLADEGAPGRYWYENSGKAVLKMVGGDVNEARKFVALLAIYSPQAKVDANSTFALRAWAQYKAGQPISVKTKVMDDKAKGALDDVDAFWSGEKTGNFFFNLLREIDPTTAGKQGATIDMWMMRAGQYDTDAPTGTQYSFMENETNRLAQELGWEPQQVQAAIWVAMKARMENSGVKKMAEKTSEKKGWIKFVPGKDGKGKVRVILDPQKHRDNWLKYSFEHDVTKDDTQQAKFDFGDGLKRHIGQVSFEARPGRTSGALPGIHTAPYAQQVEFQQAVQKTFLDAQGNDLLAMKLGLLVDSDILAPGVWQGEISPSTQLGVAMAPAKGEEGKTNVDPAQAKALNVYAAIAGLVARQEGVGWHRPFYSSTKRDANGLDIRIGRPLNPREVQDLEAAVGQWMADNGYQGWQDQFAFVSSPNGIRLVNFGIITNEKLHADILRVAESVLPDAEAQWFASSGDMMVNNWKENRNGQNYVERTRAEGRSDVLDWARAYLAPRVQQVFDEFSERYDWGDAGTIQFSRRAAGSAELVGGPGDRGDEAARRGLGDGVRSQATGAAADRQVQTPERANAQTVQGLSATDALPGAPAVRGFTGPDPRLVAVAEQYARDNGITLRRQAVYAQVDPERATRIAAAYEAMPHAPQDPRVKAAYKELIAQTTAQYRALEKAGYKFWFINLDKADNAEYASSPWNAMRDIRANKQMGVFPTDDGFGSGEFDPASNPLLEDTGIKWPSGSLYGPRKRVLANDLFRAVHDAFGHGLEGAGFRAQGEENAWQAHVRLFTGSAVAAITSETRGQNSWLNYGPNGESNRTAKVEDTVFADQKTGLMPEWTWSEGVADDMPGIMRSARSAAPIAVETARPGTVTGIHYGKAAGLSRLSGAQFGSGIKGAEQARLAEPGVDPRIKKRVYFYLTNNNADMPRPEIGLGAYVYRATLGNLLDTSTASAADMNRVQALRKTPDANGFESAVLDAGYRGYVNREQGTAVVLNADVPVAYEGVAQAGQMRDRNPERIVPKIRTRTEGNEMVRRPTGDEMGSIVGVSAELANVAPSFRLEFGEARVSQAEADAADQVLADAGSSFRFTEPAVMRSNRAIQPGAPVLTKEWQNKIREAWMNESVLQVPIDLLSTTATAYAGALANVKSGRKSKTGGPVDVWLQSDGRLLIADGQHRYVQAMSKGAAAVDVNVLGEGYSDYYTEVTDKNGVHAPAVLPMMRSNRAQTDTPQFKKWFGDSKVVDEGGKPLMVVSITSATDVTEFKVDQGSRLETGEGIVGWFGDPSFTNNYGRVAFGHRNALTSDWDKIQPEFMLPGVNSIPAYLAISRPFDARELINDLSEPINDAEAKAVAKALNVSSADLLAAIRENDTYKPGRYSTTGKNTISPHRRISADLVKTRFAVDAMKRAGFDGLIANEAETRVFGAFEPTQIKSAIGNDGNFNPANPDIRRSNRAAPNTPAFRKWFGDSKVVDAEGRPLVVYHGTNKNQKGEAFTMFDAYGSNYGLFGQGAYLTADPSVASEYTSKGRGDSPSVYPLYASIKNPIDMDAEADPQQWIDAYPDFDIEAYHEGGTTNESYYRAAEEAVRDEGMEKWEGAEAMQDGLRRMGHDGITHIGGGRVKSEGKKHRVFIAFDPEQIKSATGNDGSFDPTNPDIRRSQRIVRRQKLVGTNFEVDATSAVDAARIKLQDDGLRMKRVIEAVKAKGGTVGEAQNFYDANTLMPGRIQASIDDFKDNIIKPLLDQAAEYGIDMDELSMYAYAKHAKERNAYIASINKRLPDGGSGMTNAEADSIIQMVGITGDTAKFDDLHQRLMAITATTRQVMLAEGLITQDEFDAMDAAYDNYIPLRGFENVVEETGVARPGVGRGVNIRGAETIRAMGRKSKAGDLIENVIRDYERVVSRVEKNDVGKVLLDFVLSNPDPDLWGVDVERSKPGFNKATGTVQYTKAIEKGEDTIGVKVGGEQVYIKFADKELTRALRQAWKDETSGLERATLAMTGWWNNWMRAVLTKYNPAFALINIPRDALWSGTASALAELGPKGLAKYLAAYPQALMASSRKEAGVAGTTNRLFGNPQMDARFAEFRSAGGITGGFYMRSLDDINQDLRNDLLMAGASARNPWEAIKSLPPFKLAKLTLKLLEFMGAASENATRFALYQASRESGRTAAQSAILAKDGTTNFNRKGEWGGALNNLYLFFNAAVQGNAQLFKVLKSPAVQASMAGVAGVGMMLALYGASAGGEDDDGEAYWDKIPSYVKERNVVIMLPPGDALGGGIERVGKRGRYVLVPVQYGFNIFPNMGYVIADMLRNQKDAKRGMTPTKAALHMTSTVLGSVNPFGGAVDVSDGVQVLLAAMPTLIDLPIQLINERGVFGSPSSPAKSPFDVRPDSERMFTSQQDSVSAKIAKALNELGGGNEAKAGKLMGVETSVAPGTIQTLISATTGGLGTFIEQVGTSVGVMASSDKDLKANKIPFLNKFYGEVDEGANIKSAGDRMREVRKLSDEVKAQQKLGLDPELTSEEQRLMRLSSMQQAYDRQSAMIRKREIQIIKDKGMTEAMKNLERKQLQVERDKLATDMNREYLKVVPK